MDQSPIEREFDFFNYVNAREQVRRQKAAGQPWPWTDDPILQNYKFTNVCREHDATSQELITRFYGPHENDDPRSILLNAALSRYFGRWEFMAAIGWQDYETYDKEYVLENARYRRDKKQPVFTGAYVITNGGIAAPKEVVVLDHYIDDLYSAIPSLVEVAQVTMSWEEVAKQMRYINGFGGSGFMTKEVLTDTTYTNFWKHGGVMLISPGRPAIRSLPKDWWSWSPVGPGAARGVARVVGHDNIYSVEAQSIRRNKSLAQWVMLELSRNSREAVGINLAPHDIQFALCEFDKYERVRLGQGTPRSKYRRPS